MRSVWRRSKTPASGASSRAWSNRRLRLLAARSLVTMTFLCPVSAVTVAAQSSPDIVLWLVPTDELFPGPNQYPSTDHQQLFFDNTVAFFREHYGETLSPLVVVHDIRSKTLQDLDFARQVLGQRLVLRELSRVAEQRRSQRRIRVRFFDWSEILNVLTALPAEHNSSFPHITVAPSTWVAFLASRGIIRPTSSADPHAYLEGSLRLGQVPQLVPIWPWADRVGGRVLHSFGKNPGATALAALPWFLDLRFFFYRKDLFAVDAPRDRMEFLVAATRAAARHPGITPFAMASEADWDLLHSFSLLLWGSGGGWMTRNGFLDRDASAEALGFLGEMQRQGAISIREVRRSDLERQFLDGRLGSIVSGPWMFRQLAETFGTGWPARIGIALPPFNRPDIQPTTFVGGLNLAMTARAANDPDAAEILRYLTVDAAAQNTPGAPSAIPASRRGFERLVAGYPPEARIGELLATGLRRATSYPALPEWATVVESHSTRLELFEMFKHVREGAPELAARDLAVLRARFEWDMRRAPQLALAAIVATFAATALGGMWFFRRQRRLRVELRRVRGQWASADGDLRKARESLDLLSHQFEARVRQSERLRLEAIVVSTAPLEPGSAGFDDAAAGGATDTDILAGEIEQVRRDIRAKSEHLTGLQQQLTTYELSEQQILRRLGGSKGPIKDIPRMSPIVPKLSDVLEEALALSAVEHEYPGIQLDRRSPAAAATGTTLDRILGNSPAIAALKQSIQKVAPTRAKVLLIGEVGTGKELAAQAIHDLSRREGRFVSINCAAIPTEMFEAELFGVGPNSGLPAMHREGRIGLLEQAHRGTAFLDEIGKMPIAQQVKLLRVLESGVLVRVMDRNAAGRRVDVRIVAAFSSDLSHLVDAGVFDLALHSRLNEVQLHVPALRERREDIPLLAERFLQTFNADHGKTVTLRPEVTRQLEQMEFADNVRGLRNLVSRMVVLGSDEVGVRELDELLRHSRGAAGVDRARLRSAVRTDALRTFVACAGCLADHVERFFPKGSTMPETNPEPVRQALALLRRRLPHAAGCHGVHYELPDTSSSIVYRAELEENDLNVHFLYFLTMETLASRGCHTGVGGSLPKAVRSQMEYVRRSLFYSEPVGRKARTTLTWRNTSLIEIARETAAAHRDTLAQPQFSLT